MTQAKAVHDFDEHEMNTAFTNIENDLKKALEKFNDSFNKHYTYRVERSDDFCAIFILEGENVVFNYNGFAPSCFGFVNAFLQIARKIHI